MARERARETTPLEHEALDELDAKILNLDVAAIWASGTDHWREAFRASASRSCVQSGIAGRERKRLQLFRFS